VITVVPSAGLRSEFGRPLVGVPAPGSAAPGTAQPSGRVSRKRQRSSRALVAEPCRWSSQRVRARLGGGVRLPSSLWIAERTRAWTLDSSSRATCWSSRFIDFGMRMARKTTSSSMVCFLAAGTAMSSLCLGRRNGGPRGLLQNDVVRLLPIDLRVNAGNHLTKRSGSIRSALLSSNFSSRRKGVWP
jgi:hypothetical protein